MSKPPFVISKYVSLQDLLVDKCNYWERIALDALGALESYGDVVEDDEGYWRWVASGDFVGET